jgi:HK97 family phage prohead protease
MEIRSLDTEKRNVIGRAIPYNETSYITRENPKGERIARGAFNRSIAHRGDRIFLNLEHDERRTVGRSLAFADSAEGLVGEFHIRECALGDEVLGELEAGYWPAMSVGFKPLRTAAAAEGVLEVLEAYLGNVALTRVPAYEGAEVLALRSVDVEAIVASLGPPPDIDLTPVPPIWTLPVVTCEE